MVVRRSRRASAGIGLDQMIRRSLTFADQE